MTTPLVNTIVQVGTPLINVLGYFFSANDQVGVFDANFNQVFRQARPLKAQVIEHSQVLDHPIETGQVITDYSIVLPIEINLPVVVPARFYSTTYAEIRSLYLNKTQLTVQTISASYPNMVIMEMPHEEKPEMIDALSMLIRFRQVQVVPDPNTFVPADPANLDTQLLGQQNGVPVNGVQTLTDTQITPNLSIPAGTTVFSSVSPPELNISGVQGISGQATASVPSLTGVPVTGIQTVTPIQSIGGVFR